MVKIGDVCGNGHCGPIPQRMIKLKFQLKQIGS